MIFFRIVWALAIIVALVGVAAVVFGSHMLSKRGPLTAALVLGGARATRAALCIVHAHCGDEWCALELTHP